MSVRFQKDSFLIPGDNIVGIVTPSAGITIYSTSSKDLIQYENNPERWLRLNWKKENRCYIYCKNPIKYY